jgi:hypothetical protein
MTPTFDMPRPAGRPSALWALTPLALGACHAQGDDKPAGAVTIGCRLPAKAGFETLCSAERMASPDGTVVTVRRPDGGFRRLLIVSDGRGVVAADGVDPVRVEAADKDHIDVEADGVVYRLPATVTP